ncbi:MAG: hypothetical protein H7315_05580 [Herminiimonas sp.]|nr:hypothetical protein [Herminiimonas sp.]
MNQVFELFPTPVMRVPALLSPEAAKALAKELAQAAVVANQHSGQLAHTRILGPGESAELDAVVERMGGHLQAFGQLIFGEPLRWLVKEMWVNVLQAGGSQALHNHANCFVSGVLYLTPSDSSARTMFTRSLGGTEFAFRNAHAGAQTGPFSSEKWVAPQPEPGDLLLFPSYLLHEVPVNQGTERVTLAFNAIPHRLDAWGYAVSFQP